MVKISLANKVCIRILRIRIITLKECMDNETHIVFKAKMTTSKLILEKIQNKMHVIKYMKKDRLHFWFFNINIAETELIYIHKIIYIIIINTL